MSPKEQRQYVHIKTAAQQKGRYSTRAAEAAARTVFEQHKLKHRRIGQ